VSGSSSRKKVQWLAVPPYLVRTFQLFEDNFRNKAPSPCRLIAWVAGAPQKWLVTKQAFILILPGDLKIKE
jgi:hypothetical protein